MYNKKQQNQSFFVVNIKNHTTLKVMNRECGIIYYQKQSQLESIFTHYKII